MADYCIFLALESVKCSLLLHLMSELSLRTQTVAIVLRALTLTQISDDVGIDVTGQLNLPLEGGVGDPAVGQSEALSSASFTGELPEDLHTAGVQHLSEECGRSWHCTDTQRGTRSFLQVRVLITDAG